MGRGDIPQKWRPSLGLLIGGAVTCIIAAPFIGWWIVKWLGPIYGFYIVFRCVIVFSTCVAIILAYLSWRLLVRPIRDLSRMSRELTTNPVQATQPLRHYGTSELRDLGQTIMETGAALQTKSHQLRAFAAHTTHELKSPLAALHGAAELLQDPDLAIQTRHELVQNVYDSSKRMSDLLDQLRFMTMSVDFNKAAVLALKTLPILDQKNIRIFGNPVIFMDQNGAKIVLQQLVQNAFEHGATHIDICEATDGFLVADNGPGVEQSLLNQIFDPFFTTKRASGGTGMGLNIVRTLAESVGGEVTMWRKLGGCVVEYRQGRKCVTNSQRKVQTHPRKTQI